MRLKESLLTVVAQRLPAQVFETRTARRALSDIGRVGLAFIHVPRTAGLSVTRAVYGFDTARHFTVEQFLRVAPAPLLRLPRFTVVRNPWERAVSAYLFARAGGVPGGSLIAHPQRYRGPEFASFDRFVTGYLLGRSPHRLDGVFRPQTYYLRDAAGGMPFDHIGRFDRLGETADWLESVLDEQICITTSNGTRHSDYQLYYTDTTQRIVGELYWDDVDAFGFRF